MKNIKVKSIKKVSKFDKRLQFEKKRVNHGINDEKIESKSIP
jgi:hypothetical protein